MIKLIAVIIVFSAVCACCGRAVNIICFVCCVYIIIGIGVIILFVVGIIQEKGIIIREKISKRNIVIRWILYYTILLVIAIFGIYGPGYAATDFIYGQF